MREVLSGSSRGWAPTVRAPAAQCLVRPTSWFFNREPWGFFYYKSMDPMSVGSAPITWSFPKGLTFKPSHWGNRFQMWNFRRHKYSLYSTSQAWSYKWRTKALRGALAFSRLEGLGKTQDSPVPGPSELCFCRLQREPVSVRTLTAGLAYVQNPCLQVPPPSVVGRSWPWWNSSGGLRTSFV